MLMNFSTNGLRASSGPAGAPTVRRLFSQRASFGLDGVEMRQIDAGFELPEWDEEPEFDASPYRPYVRRPLSVFVDPAQAFVSPPPQDSAPQAAHHADWARLALSFRRVRTRPARSRRRAEIARDTRRRLPDRADSRIDGASIRRMRIPRRNRRAPTSRTCASPARPKPRSPGARPRKRRSAAPSKKPRASPRRRPAKRPRNRRSVSRKRASPSPTRSTPRNPGCATPARRTG